MRTEVENRAIELGEYIVQSGATVRSAAKKFGISKSTVHTVVTKWNGFAGGWSSFDYTNIGYSNYILRILIVN